MGMAGVAPALRTQLEGFQTSAVVLLQAGRTDQALQWADQVAARDPALGWSYNHRRGWACLARGRFEEAAQALTQTDDAHLLLAIAYVRLGRMADARAQRW